MDYQVDNTGKTLETTNINQAISDVSARPGGGVLYFPARRLPDGHRAHEEQRQALRGRGRRDSRVDKESRLRLGALAWRAKAAHGADCL